MPSSTDPVRSLLGDLAEQHPVEWLPAGAAAWARCGAAWLTGPPHREPQDAPGDAVGLVQTMLGAIRSSTGTVAALPDARLLAERAAVSGLRRRGSISCGGASRLLPAAGALMAVTLARDDDFALLPALLQRPLRDPGWEHLAGWLRQTPAEEALERARILGLAAAIVPAAAPPAVRAAVTATAGAPQRHDGPLRVLDLSSLWAGPLCAHLLGLTGADIVKVESLGRPDGARRGPRAFFDLLHAGHRSVALDFGDDEHRMLLQRLVGAADIVIESSRPRALLQLGIDAAAAVAAGTSWVSITGYGRQHPERIGYGDDVAASAGLIGRDSADSWFCGDALADPLSGVVAAAAACIAASTGHAWLLDVSMHDVCRVAATAPRPDPSQRAAEVLRPAARTPTGSAPELDAHHDEVLREWLA